MNDFITKSNYRFSPIGIDLGSANVKAVQLRKKRNSITVQNTILPTPGGTITEGIIVKPDLLVERLKKLRIDNNWHKARVNLCLPPQVLYIRRVSLPRIKDKEITRAMQLELERNFSINPAEAVYDYCRLEPVDPDDNQQEFILAAAEKRIARSYIRVVKEAGFSANILEIQPFSLLRSMMPCIKTSKAEDYSGILVDIGYQTTSIIIAAGSSYRFFRYLRTGSADFIETLADISGTDINQAGILLYKRKFTAEKKLMEKAESLAEQLQRTVTYWLEQNGNENITPNDLRICGGGAFIPGLAAVIGRRLAIRPKLHNSFRSDLYSTSNEKTTAQISAFFATAHGLALRGWSA
ncbi:MAG: pilus assembly protein PilM [Bacillota bacterium]|nr:pilus assembly protein PilM [Bacillota bacterium]